MRFVMQKKRNSHVPAAPIVGERAQCEERHHRFQQ